MYTRNRVIIICVLFMSLFSCEEYEEYIKDYDFSAVYFGTQKPLRTIVAYDEMKFKVGVALAGKRENKTDEWVKYTIDPSLLDNNNFKLLPDSYYIISNNEMMVVSKGEFIGDVTVTLDKDAFTGDPLAHLNTYALPLQITETSADSVLSGNFDEDGNELNPAKDYTVLVVKYISPLHGFYYQKGVERELDDTGAVVNETVYSEKDLSQNQTLSFSTLGLDTLLTSGAGTRDTQNNANYGLKLTRNSDNTVTIEEVAGSDMTLLEGEGTYNDEKNTFYLNYRFSDSGTDYHVVDTLVQRQAPEKDLRFEEW